MQININTDNHIDGSDRLENYFSEVLHNTLKRFEDKITGLEVHIGDENGDKTTGGDKRCLIEARVNGLNPLAVTNHADTVELAIKGAADKMKHLLEHTFDKMRTH
ncbi:HPF/RaiA family ribosome-associated protein [Flavobacterium sp. MFBS3-15]|uniref:HPF/RaiA family ribosome-associated protein n=1 Tax=Flavobacterium sp. MFBS3-15 TaxID=2989816 RepID=UPI002235EBAC|nr:HPF/RaiA family ribosome-associated protein [Flavobacterium sp. MFBS3-15]MCW4468606.1 HPF/RaiA family ribosome-associated protein [Flavobacterium sp. MFBS3-15]